MDGIRITLITISIIIIVLGLGLYFLRNYAKSQRQAIRERFPNARYTVVGASFFGQESKTAAQLRGNGSFVILAEELYFQLWLPKQEFRIPLDSITAIETVSSHLGKTRFRPLLKVIFDNGTASDSIAWDLPNMEEAKVQLEKAVKEANRL